MTKQEAKETVEEAFKQAEKYGSATIPLPREDAAGQTTIDKLRIRGTPIELIHSYFLADQLAEANAAFRTSLLENIYERLDLIEDLEVAFLPKEGVEGEPESVDCEMETTFTDDALATISRIIEEISTQVEGWLAEKMTSETKKVAILPDDCTTKVQWLDGDVIKAEVEISLHLS
jgi:hypothetical protein